MSRQDAGHVSSTVEVAADQLDGGFVARCRELPGCYAQGDTEAEAVDNLVDAIAGVVAMKMRTSVAEKMRRAPATSTHTMQSLTKRLSLNAVSLHPGTGNHFIFEKPGVDLHPSSPTAYKGRGKKKR